MNPDAMTILRDGQERFFADPPDYQAACVMFARVTQLRPDWIEGHHWLAVSHEALGQISDAETAYRTATKCDAEDPRPQVSLGRLLLNAARFREAIRELECGVKLKHHYAEADSRLFLAEAYEAAGERSKARAEWSRISKMEGFYPSYDEPMKEARRKLAQTKP
jgi:Flp pilus assembly protein TadD